MADDANADLPLFHDVVVAFIPSDDLSSSQEDNLSHLVESKGGRCIALREADQLVEDLSTVTHIISKHIEFPQYHAALEHGVHIVRPAWIVQSVEKSRQANVRQHSPDPSQFFQNVVLTCANLPEGDKDACIAGVIALGGQYSGALSKLVTHIVTLDMAHPKCHMIWEKRLKCKAVLPHWFADCFRLGRLINEAPYMLPDPEILRTNMTDRVRDLPSSHLDGAIVAIPNGGIVSTPPPSPTKSRKHLNAFLSKKIFFSKDLQLGKHLVDTLEGLINHGGGTLTQNVDDCDIYIGHYRDGKDYVTASRTGKTVGNLSWLYHVINQNRYTNPLNKLLHYPVPPNGIPGFENMRISISNYTGDARIYLENLIRYSGAEFTKTMKQDNTHLITAHTQSEKCEAAQEWNINIVNHIWLEESYARCAVQTLTNERYTLFPARTNLGEVTGQTSFDVKRLEQTYFPKHESPSKPKPSNGVVAKLKASSMKSTPSGLAPLENVHTPIIVQPDDDVTLEDEQPTTTKKPRGRPPKSAATPRSRDDEKENESPLLNGSGRAAKLKAADRLHDQADDIARFQKEMKRKGGVTHGGRRRSSLTNAEDVSSPAPASEKPRKKRTSDEATYNVTAEGSDLSDGETQNTPAKPAKRAKNAPTAAVLPPIRYKMMVSGDDRWLDNMNQESTDRLKLRQLGVLLTADPRDVDILVAPRLLRTRKFVCALAAAPKVVHTSFLDTALKDGELDEDVAMLSDEEGEQRFDVDLQETLERAKRNNRKLFEDWSVFVTRDVGGGFDTYKEIVTLNGGSCMLYAGRTGLTLPKRRLNPTADQGADGEGTAGTQEVEPEYDFVYLVSGDSEQDAKLRKTFHNMAEKQNLKARIVTTEWLLHAAMSQQIEWRDEWEWKS